MEQEFRMQDVRAFEVIQLARGENFVTNGPVVGFAVEVREDRWAAINTSLLDPLVGVFDSPHDAYKAIVKAERNE